MKQRSDHQKATHHNSLELDQASSAGPHGIAIAPPAYGLASIDHGSAVSQRRADSSGTGAKVGAKTENHTGLPNQLKIGVERLSGISLDDVRVHYNSPKPAQLQALAYAQGTEIHVAPQQERHLPHEAWHVVQQVQGRVKPTMRLSAGMPVNDDKSLEGEADVMGARAAQMVHSPGGIEIVQRRIDGEISNQDGASAGTVVQRVEEFFVPDVKEPHIHVHDGGMTFTDIGHSHKYLVRGDRTLDANVAELRKELVARGDERSLKLNRWIKHHILR